MARKVLKDNHSILLALCMNLGNTYQALGDSKKALKYMLHSLQGQRKIYKGDHHLIAGSLYNIGIILSSHGHIKNALKYELEALKMRKNLYKTNHPEIAASLNNISVTYLEFGDNQIAEVYQQEYQEMNRKLKKGSPNLDVSNCLQNVSVTDLSQREIMKLQKDLLEALENGRKVWKRDKQLINTLGLISQNYRRLGDEEMFFIYCFEIIALELENYGLSQMKL